MNENNTSNNKLTKCPVCGHEVSDDAHNCPECGHNLKQTQDSINAISSLVAVIVFIFLFFLFLG